MRGISYPRIAWLCRQLTSLVPVWSTVMVALSLSADTTEAWSATRPSASSTSKVARMMVVVRLEASVSCVLCCPTVGAASGRFELCRAIHRWWRWWSPRHRLVTITPSARLVGSPALHREFPCDAVGFADGSGGDGESCRRRPLAATRTQLGLRRLCTSNGKRKGESVGWNGMTYIINYLICICFPFSSVSVRVRRRPQLAAWQPSATPPPPHSRVHDEHATQQATRDRR